MPKKINKIYREVEVIDRERERERGGGRKEEGREKEREKGKQGNYKYIIKYVQHK